MPTPRQVVGEELIQLLESEAEGRWASIQERWPDAVRPSVDIVRVLYGSSNDDSLLVDCMNAAGFPSTLHGPNRTTTVLPDDRTELDLALADYACTTAYPAGTFTYEGWLPEHSKYLYDHIVHTQIPCFEAQGVQVAPPPSFQEYLDQQWFAIHGANEASRPSTPEEYDRISRAGDVCPNVPAEYTAWLDSLPHPQVGG